MTAMSGIRAISISILLAMLTACGGGGGGGGGGGATPAGLIALPETGQTTCSDTAGFTIACGGTGQDGALQTGVAEPSSRFTVDITGACITDNLTGLMWTRDANLPGVTRTWQEALGYANTLNICGFSDWRLSNPKELRSLVNYSLADNAATLNTLGFSNVQTNIYWSSSSLASIPTLAWVVYLSSGNVLVEFKTSSYYVWPVRAGQ